MIFSSSPSLVPPRNARRAFTLVELLVVIAIIAIVIALVLPAIASSRNSVRVSDAKNFCTQLSNAISAYVTDENRTPGHFSEADMASATNSVGPSGKGMSEAENVMLSLIGYTPATSGPSITVNPTGDSSKDLQLDPTRLGVPGQGSKQYFIPNKKFYVPQIAVTQQNSAAPYALSDPENAQQLPDLVDPWGTPILIWRQDDTYSKKASDTANYKFAADTWQPGANGKARFYWNSNACFLTATQTGKKPMDQSTLSMIGSPSAASAAAITSLAGFLGNVSDPYRPATLTTPPVVARSARASVVVQSAGTDGVYLAKKDRGGSPTGSIMYGKNFAPDLGQPVSATNQYVDKDGRATTHDVLSDFDDIFTQISN